MITGDNPTNMYNKNFGLTKQQAQISYFSNTFMYELMPFNFWKFAKQPWFKDFIVPRLISENLDEPIMSKPSFFPNPNIECYKKLKYSQIYCKYWNNISPENNIISLKNKSYTVSQIEELLNDLDTSLDFKRDASLLDIYHISQGNYREYPHPGVPVVGVFFNIKPTISGLEFKDNEFSFDNQQIKANQYTSMGDGTIETYTQILPLMKWAHQYSHQRVQTNHLYPVKFVDLCSSINTQGDLFDSDKYDKRFQNNSYIG